MNHQIIRHGRFSLKDDGSIYKDDWGNGRMWGSFGQYNQLIMYPEQCTRLVLYPEQLAQLVKIKTAWIQYQEAEYRKACAEASDEELEKMAAITADQINFHQQNEDRKVPGRILQERQFVTVEMNRRKKLLEQKRLEEMEIQAADLRREKRERNDYYDRLSMFLGVPRNLLEDGPFDLYQLAQEMSKRLIPDAEAILGSEGVEEYSSFLGYTPGRKIETFINDDKEIDFRVAEDSNHSSLNDNPFDSLQEMFGGTPDMNKIKLTPFNELAEIFGGEIKEAPDADLTDLSTTSTFGSSSTEYLEDLIKKIESTRPGMSLSELERKFGPYNPCGEIELDESTDVVIPRPPSIQEQMRTVIGEFEQSPMMLADIRTLETELQEIAGAPFTVLVFSNDVPKDEMIRRATARRDSCQRNVVAIRRP